MPFDFHPYDVPDTHTLRPCKTIADGNCLPSTGSIFAFGEPKHTSEMRVKILFEFVLQKDTYLDNEFLSRGYGQESQRNLQNYMHNIQTCMCQECFLMKEQLK